MEGAQGQACRASGQGAAGAARTADTREAVCDGPPGPSSGGGGVAGGGGAEGSLLGTPAASGSTSGAGSSEGGDDTGEDEYEGGGSDEEEEEGGEGSSGSDDHEEGSGSGSGGSEGEGGASSDDGHDLHEHVPLWFLGAGGGRARRSEVYAGCRRLSDVAPPPLDGRAQPVALAVAVATAGAAPKDSSLLGPGHHPPFHRARGAAPQRRQAPAADGVPPQGAGGGGLIGALTRARAAAATVLRRTSSGSGSGHNANAGAGAGSSAPAGDADGDGARGARRRRRESSSDGGGSGGGGGGSGGGGDSDGANNRGGWLNSARLLAARESGLARRAASGLSRAQQRHLVCERALPVHARKVRDKVDSRAYIGQWSDDGRFFIAAFQDKRVRLYDTGHSGTTASSSSSSDPPRAGGGYSGGGGGGWRGHGPLASHGSPPGGARGSLSGARGGGYGGGRASGSGGGGGGHAAAGPVSAHRAGGWKLRKDVTTRMLRWTVTDTTLSPDNRFLVYTTIAPTAYMVHVGGPLDVVESLANVTEVHDALNFAPRREHAAGGGGRGDDDEDTQWGGFGVWSVAWSPGGGEIIAGTNDRSVNVYDFETKRTVCRLVGHADDVNAVCYVEASPNIIASGSDDSTIKLWDRRVAGVTCRRPVGVLLGHTEGLTHLDARGDGRYILSNSKDQTAKLWDVRAARSPAAARELPVADYPRTSFDYRWQTYPAAGYEVRHPHDSSVQTYRGHKVLQTLIRAYFSPAHSTGQRYIYSGSACGGVYIWDLITARQVAVLRHHRAVVRDCSWHPHEPELASVSWDGTVVQWDAAAPGAAPEDAAEAALRREAAVGRDRFDGY